MLAFVGFVMAAQVTGLGPLAALGQHLSDPISAPPDACFAACQSIAGPMRLLCLHVLFFCTQYHAPISLESHLLNKGWMWFLPVKHNAIMHRCLK